MAQSTLQELSTATMDLVKRSTQWTVMVGEHQVTPRTGVLISDHRILTVALEARENEEVPVTIEPGREPEVARVSAFFPGSGLAVLRLETRSGEWEPRTGEAAPQLGQLVVTAAYPSPEGYESRLGMVRCVGSDGSYFQTDSPAFPGFAGAPIFDLAGEFIGMTMLGTGGNGSISVPAGRITGLLDGSIADTPKYGPRVRLGVSTRTVPVAAGLIDATEREALFVETVASDAPAADAGIRYGDVIVTIGGREVASPYHLARALAHKSVGDTVTISLIRAAEQIEVEAVLGEWSEDDRMIEEGGGHRGHGHHHGHHRYRHHHHGGNHWRRRTVRMMMG